MMFNNDVVEAMYKLDHNTIVVSFRETVIDLDHIKETYAMLYQLAEDKPHKKLILTGKKTAITKEARYYGMQEAKRIGGNVLAEAVIVHSLYQKMVINFYSKFIDSTYPTRFFTDIEKAKEWLANF